MRSIATLVATAALLAMAGASVAQELYTPSTTKVAILPSVNMSQEKDQKQQEEQAKAVDSTLRDEFSTRGFQVVEQEAIRKAIADLKLDLSDEENHKRSNILEVGKAVGADVVVFAAITDVRQTLHTGIFASNREGTASLKAWVIDVKSEKPALSAKVLSSKSGGSFFSGLDKGSSRIVRACSNAVRQGLKDYLKPYPVLKEQKGK